MIQVMIEIDDDGAITVGTHPMDGEPMMEAVDSVEDALAVAGDLLRNQGQVEEAEEAPDRSIGMKKGPIGMGMSDEGGAIY